VEYARIKNGKCSLLRPRDLMTFSKFGLELARNEDNAALRELETGVRKAKTMNEVIGSFDKVCSDVEFETIKKARISPEQTELQIQLRRDLRVSSS